MIRKVQIAARQNGEIVREFTVTDKTDRQVQKMISGIEINLDHERYEVLDTETEV